MKADISDNLNLLAESIEGIADNWDEIVMNDELINRAIHVLETVASTAYSIQLLVNFNAIWLTDSENETLEEIQSFVSTGITELERI